MCVYVYVVHVLGALLAFGDQVFSEGFSLATLQRLAVLMEHQEQPVATVVRRKGAAVDEVGVRSSKALAGGDRTPG